MAIQEPTSAPASAPAPAPVERASVTENGRYNFRAAAVVGFIVGVVDIFIAARFLGKLFGASSQSAFVNFIYQVSAPMVAPFTGIFGNSGSSTNTFETVSLVAIVVYAVIGWGLVVLIRIATAPRGTKPASLWPFRGEFDAVLSRFSTVVLNWGRAPATSGSSRRSGRRR